MREYEYEPVKGLPENLPEGEFIVWQGQPAWGPFARRVFHIVSFSFYFLALLCINVVYQAMAGAELSVILSGLAWQSMLAATALGLMILVGWLYARSTVYTLTNRRFVVRSGIVTPMMANLPLDSVASAGVRWCRDGTGDFLVQPKEGTRKLFYTLLWPHVRPWRFRPVQPLLRAVAQPQELARLLKETVEELHEEQEIPRVTTPDAADGALTDATAG